MTKYQVAYDLTYDYEIEAESPRAAAILAMNAAPGELRPQITREGDIFVSWEEPVFHGTRAPATLHERTYGDPNQADEWGDEDASR